MKVQIDGNVIDTTLIYRIGEIEKRFPFNNCDYFSVISIYFKIYFLNKNELEISISVGDDLDNDINRITNCRNKLIEIWKENQSCIPEIKL